MGERALFRFRRAPLLAQRRPYNTFGAKIYLGLRYSANEDENKHHCGFDAGAPVSIGEGLPAPAAPLWIRPWYADTPQPVFSSHVLKFYLPLTLSQYLYIVPQTLTFTGPLVGDLEAVLLPALASQQFAEAAVRAVVGSAHGPAEGTQFATFGCADAAGDAIPQPTLLPFLTHALGALSCRRQVETVTTWEMGGDV